MSTTVPTTLLQNLATVSFTPDQLKAIDDAIDALETNAPGLISLTTERRKTMTHMGELSEPFCRRALTVLSQNPAVLPRGISMDDAQADLQALDQWRPRVARLTRFFERAVDTEAALGSDVMAAAMVGYRALKSTGELHGLRGLAQELGARFQRTRQRAGKAPAAAAPAS